MVKRTTEQIKKMIKEGVITKEYAEKNYGVSEKKSISNNKSIKGKVQYDEPIGPKLPSSPDDYNLDTRFIPKTVPISNILDNEKFKRRFSQVDEGSRIPSSVKDDMIDKMKSDGLTNKINKIGTKDKPGERFETNLNPISSGNPFIDKYGVGDIQLPDINLPDIKMPDFSGFNDTLSNFRTTLIVAAIGIGAIMLIKR